MKSACPGQAIHENALGNSDRTACTRAARSTRCVIASVFWRRASDLGARHSKRRPGYVVQKKRKVQSIEHTDIAEYLREVRLDGPLGNVEAARDLLVAGPSRDRV